MRTGVKIMALSLCMLFLIAPIAALPIGADEAPATGSRAVTYQPNRVVVGELFTGTWCGFCRFAEQAMDIIVDDEDYFDQRFVLVEWHSGDVYNCSDSDPRASYYSVSGYPTAMFDGVQSQVGAGTTDGAQTAYEGKIDGRSDKADIFVEIDSALTNGDTEVDVWINVTAFADISATNLQMRAVLIEDEDFWDGQYPIRMTARGFVLNEATTITTKDQVVFHSANMALDPAWVLEDLAVVAWVQTDTTKEILNGNINHIEINDPVTKSDDIDDIIMNEDEPDTSIDLDDYFTDPEGADLPWDFEGADKLNFTVGAGNTVTITPEAEWSGQEHIVLWANDKYNMPLWTEFDVTVNNVNDAPELGDPTLPDVSLTEAQTKEVFKLAEYFTDIDDTVLTFSFSGQDQVTVVVDGEWIKMTAPDGIQTSFTETVTFKAQDAAGLFVTDEVLISVSDVNHAPTQDQQFSTIEMDEDGTTNFDLDDYFSDPDPYDTLVYGVTGNLNVDVDTDAENVVTLTPIADWHGEEELTVTADDSVNTPIQATVSVVVDPVNDLPELTGTAFEEVVFEEDDDQTTLQAVSSLFTDRDGDTLVYSLAGSDDDVEIILNQDLTVSFEPERNWYGFKEYIIKAKDGEGFAQYNASVEVTSVNDPIVIDSYTPLAPNIDIRENDDVAFMVVASDPDGDAPTFIWTLNSEELTGLEDKYTFETDYASSGTYIIKVKVTDGESEETISWTLKVKDQNRAPEVSIITPAEGDEYDKKEMISFKAEATDADDDDLTVKWYVDGKAFDTDFEFTNTLLPGEHTIKVVVNDGKGGTAEDSVNLNVKGKTVTPTTPASSGPSGLLIAAIVGVVIAVLVITLVVLKMRGKKGPETPEDGQTPPPPPPPGYDQGYQGGYDQGQGGYDQGQGGYDQGYQDPNAQQPGYNQNQY